ncbi:MAG TPA: hypothetical protein DEB73_03210 [Candidatus Magasanikbacteria bacterium]|uniref:Transglutaminase-like domain-containing protein n=1 Tax=Candidatus Magasanikbacteria bacterium GW2011_GWA2_42_32 TaxID=1619039 RepID=A0A0G0ZZ76_9BACT|nr:MAG: hypothetical protein UV20_C0043G0004 [Candidatus Magasanikbacteria bacterium GW2011_GWA2_42_32]HBV58239.1 hypothetical protein [Candidatus Magasanikbacteria bacterium]HBX16035.1 hypothetical protein [Candidatus Magasanikbacteria bacterium]
MRRDIDRDTSNVNFKAPEQTGRDFDNVSPLEIFREVSAAGSEDMAALDELDHNIGQLPPEPLKAAEAIRSHLIKEGYEYGNSFRLQDMLKKKQGNCLGLACLIGGLLERRGFHPEYNLLLGPKDYAYSREVELFEEFVQGDHFDFDNPIRPLVSEEINDFTFVALEHPILVLNGKQFETTDLVPESEFENTKPFEIKSERSTKISYAELASNVLVSRAVSELFDNPKPNYALARKLLAEAIRRWPNNREAYAKIRNLANNFFDDEQEETSRKKYLALGGDDSRFFDEKYSITHDPSDLDKVLERHPSYIEAYVDKEVYNETNHRNARFAFAVAAQCVARSQTLDLGKFYVYNSKKFAKLFGKEDVVRFIVSAAEDFKDFFSYNIALYELTGDKKYLTKIKQDGLITCPFQEAFFYYTLEHMNGKLPKQYQEKYRAFLEQYGNRRTFNEQWTV